VGDFTNHVNYFVRCRGCKREIAVVVEFGGEDGKQTKALSRTFHTLSECSYCHERHLYDCSDLMTSLKPEPALPFIA